MPRTKRKIPKESQMRRFMLPIVTVHAVLFFSSNLCAQNDPKEIIQKAIDAGGGAAHSGQNSGADIRGLAARLHGWTG